MKRRSCVYAEQDYGATDAPVMVLLHGYGANSSWWQANLASLSCSHHVYVLDIRYTSALEHMVADLVDWIVNNKGWQRPLTLMGHSLGARLCLQLAIQIPHLVERLVLVNPAVGLPEVPVWAWIWRCYQARMVSKHPEDIKKLFHSVGPVSSWKWVLRGLRTPMPNTLIHIPTLIFWGERDPLFPPRYSARLHSCLTQGTILQIAAGHCIMRDHPELFYQAVSAFLLSSPVHS